MRRGIWFAAGAGVSIYAMVRGRRAAQTLTVDGLRDRMQALALGARMFRDEVAQGQAEKESQLRERLLPAYDTTHQLSTASTPLASIEEGQQ